MPRLLPLIWALSLLLLTSPTRAALFDIVFDADQSASTELSSVFNVYAVDPLNPDRPLIPIEIVHLSLVSTQPAPSSLLIPFDNGDRTDPTPAPTPGPMGFVEVMGPPPGDRLSTHFHFEFAITDPAGNLLRPEAPEIDPPMDPDSRANAFDAILTLIDPFIHPDDPLTIIKPIRTYHFEAAPHLVFTNVGAGSVFFDLLQIDDPPENYRGPLFTITLTAQVVPEPSSALIFTLGAVLSLARYSYRRRLMTT